MIRPRSTRSCARARREPAEWPRRPWSWSGTASASCPERPDCLSSGLTIGVAVGIPEPYATELREWRHKFGDPMASAIPPHVTLLPPTEVEVADRPLIE